MVAESHLWAGKAITIDGEVAERLKALVSKTGRVVRPSRVRIPPSPFRFRHDLSSTHEHPDHHVWEGFERGPDRNHQGEPRANSERCPPRRLQQAGRGHPREGRGGRAAREFSDARRRQGWSTGASPPEAGRRDRIQSSGSIHRVIVRKFRLTDDWKRSTMERCLSG